jgi:7-hydroxymethyl chlorophyll a reductase
MQDYQVHVKHADGAYETVPYFCLPASELNDVIAPSCYSCFDYVNALADLTVGYMAVPAEGVPMTAHNTYVTVRNARGAAMLAAAAPVLVTSPPRSGGNRTPFVTQTVLADDAAKLGTGPKQPAPLWLGKLLARALTAVGPTGLEFARYSIDYHTVRNALYTWRTFPAAQAEAHVPPYALRMVDAYDQGGAIRSRVALRPGAPQQTQAEGAQARVALAILVAILAAVAAWLALAPAG